MAVAAQIADSSLSNNAGRRERHWRILYAKSILQSGWVSRAYAQLATSLEIIYPRGDRTNAFKGLVGRARPGTCAKQFFSLFLHARTQSVPGFPSQLVPHP